MDVVEAVAGAELIVFAELMIQLSQEVGVVNRIGKQPGGDLRAPDSRQPLAAR